MTNFKLTFFEVTQCDPGQVVFLYNIFVRGVRVSHSLPLAVVTFVPSFLQSESLIVYISGVSEAVLSFSCIYCPAYCVAADANLTEHFPHRPSYIPRASVRLRVLCLSR